MRIVLLTRSLERGGAERQIVTLARGLKDRGHDVTVLTLFDRGPLGSELRDVGLAPVSLGKTRRWQVVGPLVRLVSRVRAARADALISYLVAPNLLAALARPWLGRTRLIWSLRASDMDFADYGPFEEWTFRVAGRLANASDRILVNSSAGLEHHARAGYPRERMVRVPNGIDVERFRYDPAGRARLRGEWRIAEGTPLVGIVARLDPMKDHETFLRAAFLLLARRPDVRFAIVGDGRRDDLRDSAAATALGDRVVWAGARDDVPAVYSALDLGTLCSRYGEGFPNAVAEGLACGLPTVVTDVGDAARIVGRPDRVVAPGDAEGLAAAWGRVLDEGVDSRERAGSALRERIVERYSVARLVDDVERAARG